MLLSVLSGVQQLFPALHAPLPCTTLLARGYVHYWKRKKKDLIFEITTKYVKKYDSQQTLNDVCSYSNGLCNSLNNVL